MKNFDFSLGQLLDVWNLREPRFETGWRGLSFFFFLNDKMLYRSERGCTFCFKSGNSSSRLNPLINLIQITVKTVRLNVCHEELAFLPPITIHDLMLLSYEVHRFVPIPLLSYISILPHFSTTNHKNKKAYTTIPIPTTNITLGSSVLIVTAAESK